MVQAGDVDGEGGVDGAEEEEEAEEVEEEAGTLRTPVQCTIRVQTTRDGCREEGRTC